MGVVEPKWCKKCIGIRSIFKIFRNFRTHMIIKKMVQKLHLETRKPLSILCTFFRCKNYSLCTGCDGDRHQRPNPRQPWRDFQLAVRRRLLAKKVHLAATRQNCQTYTSSVLENCIFFKDSSSKHYVLKSLKKVQFRKVHTLVLCFKSLNWVVSTK